MQNSRTHNRFSTANPATRRTRASLVFPAPPSSFPRRRRTQRGNPVQPSLAYQPSSPTTHTPGRPLAPLPLPLPRRSRASRSREGGNPVATVTRLPTDPTTTHSLGLSRSLRSPLPPSSFPRLPRRSREGGNPAQPSLAYQPSPLQPTPPVARSLRSHSPSLVFPAKGDLCITRRPRASLALTVESTSNLHRLHR